MLRNKLEEEIILVSFLLFITIFAFLSVDTDAGIVLFMMLMGYLISLGSPLFKEVEIIRSDRKSRDPAKISLLVFGGVIVWIIINSVLYSFSEGTFSLFNPDVFSAIYLYANIPIVSNAFAVVYSVWGGVFPIIENLFACSFLLILYNRIIFGRWRMPQKIDKRNITKVLVVCALIGASMSLIHLQVRGTESWALVSDNVFFTLSGLITYNTKQTIEGTGVHAIINQIVLLYKYFTGG